MPFLNREDPALPEDLISSQGDSDGSVAEVDPAALDFALRQGFRGTFIEVQLGLLDALRDCARGVSTGDLRHALEPSGTAQEALDLADGAEPPAVISARSFRSVPGSTGLVR
jgi:hypothetical protein